jgi:hypothetical protein
MRALLIGAAPDRDLGYQYCDREPYDAVVLGSVTLGQLMGFREERVLEALGEGKPVLLFTPGLPQVKNRALAAALAQRYRELKSWGVVFSDGGRRHLVTAQEAKLLRRSGRLPEPGAVLTPLAREILEGSD